MKNEIILFVILFFVAPGVIKAQDKYLGDTIVNLPEVLVKPPSRVGFSVLSPKRGKKMNVGGETGKTAFVSKVNIEKNRKYNIKAVEFFFNYKKRSIGINRFYIRPLLLTSIEGKPSSDYLKSETIYIVSEKLKETVYIDLSRYNIEIENVDAFFVGVEFVGKDGGDLYDDFNVTMLRLKNETGVSFVKGNCPKCVFSPFYLSDNIGLTLKYNIYYK